MEKIWTLDRVLNFIRWGTKEMGIRIFSPSPPFSPISFSRDSYSIHARRTGGGSASLTRLPLRLNGLDAEGIDVSSLSALFLVRLLSGKRRTE